MPYGNKRTCCQCMQESELLSVLQNSRDTRSQKNDGNAGSLRCCWGNLPQKLKHYLLFIRIAFGWYNKEFLFLKNASVFGLCMLILSQEKNNYRMEGGGNNGNGIRKRTRAIKRCKQR